MCVPILFDAFTVMRNSVKLYPSLSVIMTSNIFNSSSVSQLHIQSRKILHFGKKKIGL